MNEYDPEIGIFKKRGKNPMIESTFRFIRNEDTGEPEIVGVSREITEKRF